METIFEMKDDDEIMIDFNHTQVIEQAVLLIFNFNLASVKSMKLHTLKNRGEQKEN